MQRDFENVDGVGEDGYVSSRVSYFTVWFSCLFVLPLTFECFHIMNVNNILVPSFCLFLIVLRQDSVRIEPKPCPFMLSPFPA